MHQWFCDESEKHGLQDNPCVLLRNAILASVYSSVKNLPFRGESAFNRIIPKTVQERNSPAPTVSMKKRMLPGI